MIIAIDFDGVLCENKFPDIGTPNYKVISAVRRVIDMGHEVILWTSRVDAELEAAIAWCEDRGLHFCSINDNAPSNKKKYEKKYPNGTRKVYADVYVDDHSIDFVHDVKIRAVDRNCRLDAMIRSLIAVAKEENYGKR